MEGYNPAYGCTTGCKSMGRYWVPKPRSIYPRRDALIDAIGRTDNPCERPARCGPCCEPLPKFRLPKELPECNPDCFPEERMRAKQEEACENYRKFVECCCPPQQCTPEMEIEPLDPEIPIAVELPQDTSPENTLIMKELSCRTNIIAGFFNPDDNKTPEQKLREQCDRTCLSCGPNLPLYPCRGAIEYPRITYTTLADEMNKCNKFICQDTKYCDPQYIQEQMELKKRQEMQRKMEEQRQAEEMEFKKRFLNPNQPHPCCANEKLSLTPYCSCGCDYFSNM